MSTEKISLKYTDVSKILKDKYTFVPADGHRQMVGWTYSLTMWKQYSLPTFPSTNTLCDGNVFVCVCVWGGGGGGYYFLDILLHSYVSQRWFLTARLIYKKCFVFHNVDDNLTYLFPVQLNFPAPEISPTVTMTLMMTILKAGCWLLW